VSDTERTTLSPQEQVKALAKEVGRNVSFNPADFLSIEDHRLFRKDWRMIPLADTPNWKVSKLVPVVEGIIGSENLVFIAAPTQSRKTLLGLYMLILLDRGGKLFGKFPVAGGHNVLYVVLEDPDRRIKARLMDIDQGMDGEFAHCRSTVFQALGLSINDPEYFSVLEEAIVDGGFDVVFIDTYQKATPGMSSFEDKEQSVILHRLSNLTRKHHATVIVLDHLRKDMNQGRGRRHVTIDDIKGTGGKAQNADVIILLENMGESRMAFHSFSKDWETPVNILVDVSPQDSGDPKFQYAGEVAEGRNLEASHQKLLDAIEPGEEVSSGDLVKRTGGKTSTVGRYLTVLTDQGKLIKTGKGKGTRYQLCT